jgi:hypothetical protein
MRLWSIHPSYLDKQGLCGLWLESLLAQSVLLKGEYTECPRCSGMGWGLVDKANNNEGYNDCHKCKGIGKIKTSYYNHPPNFGLKYPIIFPNFINHVDIVRKIDHNPISAGFCE